MQEVKVFVLYRYFTFSIYIPVIKWLREQSYVYTLSPYPYTSVISPGRAICWSIPSSCDVAKLQVLSQLLQLTRLTIHVKSALDMYMVQYKHICTNMGKSSVLQLLKLPVWGPL